MYLYVALGARDGAAAGMALLLGAFTMSVACYAVADRRAEAAYAAIALVVGVAMAPPCCRRPGTCSWTPSCCSTSS